MFPLKTQRMSLFPFRCRLFANPPPLQTAALVQLQHHLHEYPELSNHEHQTAAYLQSALTAHGLPAERITPCFAPGFYADIVGEGPPAPVSRCIAFRAEMDALATVEGNHGLPYRSKTDGVAHLCGHDGHMSIVVGLGWELLKRKSVIPNNCKVRLIFQPAEETPPGGALPMIQAGCLTNVDEIYAFHNINTPVGTIVCRDTNMFSQASIVKIILKGKSGHGAYPHLNSDCVLTAAYILTQMHSIIPRSVSCFREAVLTICQIHAGSAHNVLPEQLWMEGSIRSYNSDVHSTLKSRISSIVASTSASHNCLSEVKFQDGYPPTLNHSSSANLIRTLAASLFGPSRVIDADPSSASEDFSYFLQKVPGAMVFLGNGTDRMLHTADYCFTESLLEIGVQLWLRVVQEKFGIEI